MKDKIKNILFDAAIILFIALAVMAAAESGLRAYERFSSADEAPAAPQVREWSALAIPEDERPASEAYRGIGWAADFMKEVNAHPGTGFAYEPFVLWRHNPYKNKYITFSEDGYRLTVPEKTPGCARHKKVFFFGGSTINGDGIIRDQDTIPSLFAKRAADERLCMEVRSYSQSGFNQGNEYTLLLSLLAKGDIPDLVVFYDGVNDATHRVAYGIPHMAYDRFANTVNGFTGNPWYVQMVVESLRKRLAVARALLPPKPNEVQKREKLETDPSVIAQRAAAVSVSYRGTLDVAHRLGKSYGFKTFLILQPTLFHKSPKSADETKIIDATDALTPGIRPSIESLYGQVRLAFKKNDPCRCLIDLSGILEHTPDALFIDYAHVSPRGNEIITLKIFEALRERNAF